MNPVFTLPYPEFAVAQEMQKLVRSCSVFVPASRQQKSIDLLLLNLKTAKVVSIQVKSSRVYPSTRRKDSSRRRFLHTTFFRVFDVPPEPNWFILIGIYPQEQGHTKSQSPTWWSTIMLAFTQKEMSQFMRTVRTRSGKADQFFYFSFDNKKEIFQTRGREDGAIHPFTEKLLDNRISELCNALN